MAILLKDLLKVSERDVRIFNAITKQESDKASCLKDVVIKTRPYVDKYGNITTDVYVKSVEDLRKELVNKKYYSMADHCVFKIIKTYILLNSIYITSENDKKDLQIIELDEFEEKIKNKIFQTPK